MQISSASSLLHQITTKHCPFWLSSVEIDARYIWWALLKCRKDTKMSQSIDHQSFLFSSWYSHVVGKIGKSHGKCWKILWLIYIVSIFFIVIKKIAKNWGFLHQPNSCNFWPNFMTRYSLLGACALATSFNRTYVTKKRDS